MITVLYTTDIKAHKFNIYNCAQDLRPRMPHPLRTIKPTFAARVTFFCSHTYQQQCFHVVFHRIAPLRIDVPELWKCTSRILGANIADTLS